VSAWVWIAGVLVGGMAVIARFWLDALVSQLAGRQFPIGTLLVNLTGSFALGVLTGLGFTGTLLLIAGTATIGSYTTLSTWMLESYRLTEDAQPRPALVNALASLALGFGAALVGRTIGLHL
jgi:fluoride exporter